MRRPRALYYSILSYQPENIALIERLFDVVVLPDPRSDTAELLGETEVLFGPLGFPVSAARMAACPRLRVIISNTTGVPHIEMDAAAARGIAVCALHDEPAFLETITATAEHTIGLMLATWRRIHAAHAAAVAGHWDRRPWGAPRMFSRMRLGIVGFGRLGRKVARVAEAMGMKISYFDPHVPGGAGSLIELARGSDILSLHAPANAETRGLVSRSVLEALPRGAMVINTARGELLDVAALLDLLESGHLGAAALDTVDGEYDPDFSSGFAGSRLAKYARDHDNLVLTPHIGGSTIDAWRETERFVVLKAARILGLDVPA
jgi:D-3-phosphoglycerate dehydrogenase / 2-oxoglutarate reductase